MKHVGRIGLYSWQLLQHLAGLGVLGLCRASGQKVQKNDGIWYVEKLFGSGVCLGDYIIMETTSANARDIAHERGHQRQSRLLGPLYLPIVGIPSLAFNIASRYSHKIAKGYYRRFPENWADKLAGIKRDDT
ncbi:MAG: hypothetical protein WC966_08985 [Bradymonadales bacterium]|jgi:hypothetical protein